MFTDNDQSRIAAMCWKRGTEAMNQQNWDYAIEMFAQAATLVPENLLYRQSLRGCETRKYGDTPGDRPVVSKDARRPMPSDRKTNWILPVTVGGVVLLLGLYVGAYYIMVSPEPGGAGFFPFYGPPGDWSDTLDMATGARIHFWCRSFFRPMHWLDRHLRPRVWEP